MTKRTDSSKGTPYQQWAGGTTAVVLLYCLSLLLGAALTLRELIPESAAARYGQVAFGCCVFLVCLVGARRRKWSAAECGVVALLSLGVITALGYMLFPTASVSSYGAGFLIAAAAGGGAGGLLRRPGSGKTRKRKKRR